MASEKTAPFLARIAGLSSSAMLELQAPELLHLVQQQQANATERAAALRTLTEELFALIGAAAAKDRRRLLALRRDCHNDRPLARHRAGELWSTVSEACPSAERLAALDDEAQRLQQELAELHARKRQEATESLLRSATDPAFFRGLALASPVLARRLKIDESRMLTRAELEALPPRRRRKARLSLLRYVSRAATKLSPYSTLTSVALGQTVDEPEPRFPVWHAGPWRERSLVRIRRYLGEQLAEAWRHGRTIHPHLPVVPNRSLEQIGPHFRYLRPPAWRRAPDDAALEPRPLLLARVESNPLFGELLTTLGDHGAGYADVLARLAASLAIPSEQAKSILDKALELGLVSMVFPWPDNHPSLELCLLASLRSENEPNTSSAPLARLTAAEQGFAHTSQPVQTLAGITAELETTWQALTRSTELQGVELWRPRTNEIFEDVLWEPAGDHPGIKLSHGVAEGLLRDLEAWTRLSFAVDRRFDVLHTLAAAARRTWPDRSSIGALELFAKHQALWREVLQPQSETPSLPNKGFNPLGLQKIDQLERLRRRIRKLVDQAALEAENGQLSRQVLAAIAAEVPDRYRVPLGPCALLQPADTSGDLWVLNHLFEGTGRYGSRFAALLSRETRERYLDAFRSRSVIEGPTGSLALLDLSWSHGDNLSAHPPLTRLLLATPGENLDPPGAEPRADASKWELVAPRDLVIELPDDPDALPLLKLGDRQLIPVHLGGAATRFLPSWLRFLALWGPDTTTGLKPSNGWRRLDDEVEVQERLTIGSVVIRRQRWRVGPDRLRKISHRSGVDAYRTLHRWREAHGLPSCLYLIEKIGGAGDRRYKPQFLDLSCPLFVELLQSVGDDRAVVFEEALPTPEAYGPAMGGSHRGQELLLDAMAFHGFGNR